MAKVQVTRTIKAPVSRVFQAFTDIENMPNTSPEILRTEFLGETRVGAGTKFREVRLNNNKEMAFDLEVLAYEKEKLIRMVNDTHGTTWDTTITFQKQGDSTDLNLVMEAKAFELLPRILNPLLKGLYRKNLEKHVTNLQSYCEQQ
jgi:uncharacterized protein YndB with AHSA1/START domain